jgi:hypothetical protein
LLKSFNQNLLNLKGSFADVSPNSAYLPENGYASISINFSNGTRLRADYWRIVENHKASISSFDHNQKYGLPAPIDAITQLKANLDGRFVEDARHEKETGDLWFEFTNRIRLQIFNVTGYEIWEISFPDGTTEYSNYAK